MLAKKDRNDNTRPGRKKKLQGGVMLKPFPEAINSRTKGKKV